MGAPRGTPLLWFPGDNAQAEHRAVGPPTAIASPGAHRSAPWEALGTEGPQGLPPVCFHGAPPPWI